MKYKSIEAKILKVENKKALLEIDSQPILIRSDVLPANALTGDKIRLYFLNPEQAISTDKKFAKIVLEEILNGN